MRVFASSQSATVSNSQHGGPLERTCFPPGKIEERFESPPMLPVLRFANGRVLSITYDRMYEVTALRDFTLEETPDHVATNVSEGEVLKLTDAEVAKHVAAGDVEAPEGFVAPEAAPEAEPEAAPEAPAEEAAAPEGEPEAPVAPGGEAEAPVAPEGEPEAPATPEGEEEKG